MTTTETVTINNASHFAVCTDDLLAIHPHELYENVTLSYDNDVVPYITFGHGIGCGISVRGDAEWPSLEVSSEPASE
jgi:hypothetical protein